MSEIHTVTVELTNLQFNQAKIHAKKLSVGRWIEKEFKLKWCFLIENDETNAMVRWIKTTNTQRANLDERYRLHEIFRRELSQRVEKASLKDRILFVFKKGRLMEFIEKNERQAQ